MSSLDAVTLAVLKGRLEQIADEMDATLFRTAFNPSTFERADDAAGSMWSAIGGHNLSDIELAKGKITEIDAALAKLVGDGNTDKAAATFKALSDEAQRQGISVDDLKKKFPQYTEALAGATSATVEATDSVADYATAAQTAVDATKAFSDSIKGVAQPLLDERDAARQVETSIDAVSKALNPDETDPGYIVALNLVSRSPA